MAMGSRETKAFLYVLLVLVFIAFVGIVLSHAQTITWGTGGGAGVTGVSTYQQDNGLSVEHLSDEDFAELEAAQGKVDLANQEYTATVEKVANHYRTKPKPAANAAWSWCGGQKIEIRGRWALRTDTFASCMVTGVSSR
jgi:hypothetical protein